MPQQQLRGTRVAILATDGVEQAELERPRDALREAGADVELVSPKRDKIKAWDMDHWSHEIDVDRSLDNARPADFDALMLPGGVMNPDKLRQIPQAVEFVRAFFDEGKPVAAICHAPWMLVEAHVVRGRTLTSWPSLRTDIENAGADWTDREVVVDGGLVTSRKPDDIPAFCREMIRDFAERRSASKAGVRDAARAGASSPGGEQARLSRPEARP